MAAEEAMIPVDRKAEQKKIIRSFILYNLGVFLFWSSYASISNLQSSVNVEDGLGATTLAVSFIAAIVFALFFVTVLVRKHGAKFWMVAGDASLFPFILANLYPRYYTLVPAAILMGVMGCTMWTCMSILNVRFASWYSGVSKRPLNVHTMYFSGYFFLVYQASQVCGNLISYVILYAFDQTTAPDFSTSQNNSWIFNTTTPATATSTNSVEDIQNHFCGANDCQDPSLIEKNIDQYRPVNRVSFFVLVGVILSLEFVATLIHFFFIPGTQSFVDNIERHRKAALQSRDCGDDTIALNSADDNLLQGDAGAKTDVMDENESRAAEKTGIVELTKAAFWHCVQPKLLLLAPLTIYNGLAMSFAFTELTRAYASCSMGVQWVGICMAVYSLSDSILSWVVGKFGRKISRVVTVFICLVLEYANYIYSLHWAPGPHVLPSVLAIFFMFGFTDGVFQTIINVIHVDYFEEDQDIVINIWNILVVIGYAVGTLMSTAICVYVRMYFNMSCLGIGFLGLVVADYLHRREMAQGSTQKKESDTNGSLTQG